jgi:hypothetical protein
MINNNLTDICFYFCLKTHYTNALKEQKLLIKRSFNEQLFGAVRSLSVEAVFQTKRLTGNARRQGDTGDFEKIIAVKFVRYK